MQTALRRLSSRQEVNIQQVANSKTTHLHRAARHQAVLGSCPTNRPPRLGVTTLRNVSQTAPWIRTACSRRATALAAVAVAPPPIAEKVEVTTFEAGVRAEVVKSNGTYTVRITASRAEGTKVNMHWAINDWQSPPSACWPAGTFKIDDKAVQTPLSASSPAVITFPEAATPSRIVFVLKELSPEAWINNGGVDFAVQLKPPDKSWVVNKVVNLEATASHWSLLNRFVLVNEVLDAAEAAGPDGMAFMLTWLRLSGLRHLDWYRNANYQSKDMAHTQKTVAQRFADKARTAEDPLCRLYARMCLALLPRGGGNGDDIRMGILHIMRGNGIKEGHRPGHDEPFLEQWHQKLHTNTTPDDIVICEAYLAFLHSGNHDDYRRVLWDKGRLTEEKLATMSKPIKSLPHHLPHLIDPFKGYLWTLKVTHSGADLDTAAHMASGQMDEELRWIVFDILANRDAWWVPGKIVTARQRLAGYWRDGGSAPRDIVLLDIALEEWFRLCIERVDKPALAGDDLCTLVSLVLANGLVAVEQQELRQCLNLWDKLNASSQKWSKEWSLQALAAAQRTELSLSASMDSIYQAVQPHANNFGTACEIDPQAIANFGEEVVRGQPVFMLSLLLQHLEPMLRSSAGVAPWQVVSQGSGSAAGAVLAVASLADIQGHEFAAPTVVVAEAVGGLEDIPAAITAVLTRSSMDVLSHVAIRARSQGVLLATCYDAAAWDALKASCPAGSPAAVTVDAAGNVRGVTGAAAAAVAAANGNGLTEDLPPLKLPAPKATDAWALSEDEFDTGRVGGKSQNLKQLRAKLPSWVKAPASVAMPFGSFEKVLEHPSNSAAAKLLKMMQAKLGQSSGAEAFALLGAIRTLVAEGLQAPADLPGAVAGVAASAGLIPSPSAWAGTDAWQATWQAVCGVWASKWSERAWLSRRARGVPDHALYMAVLLQQVVPAQYAYVLHTANPVTGAHGELFGEAVVGMGETLVGNHPGRALSFKAPLNGGSGAVELLSLPSKRSALFAPPGGTVIARSDANGEDLESFAGAGLYDSVPVTALVEAPVDYAADAMFMHGGERDALLAGLVKVGAAAQEAFGGAPQDVEGVWVDGQFYVVQCRPQVL